MTSKDKGHYSKKHPPDIKVRPELVEAVKEKARDGQISCAAAFGIADRLNILPSEAGIAIDSSEIKIDKCQLGIFGYGNDNRIVKPAESVSTPLKNAIGVAMKEGRLPCDSAWAIAEKLGIGKMDVTAACENLGVKISSCQLGAF